MRKLIFSINLTADGCCDHTKGIPGDSKSGNDFALAFDAVDNIVVFSRTLDKAESPKTRIVRGNLEAEIRKLKQQPGKNILLGGVDLPSQLVHTGLIDEYRLVFHPVLAGEGTRLFQGISLQESVPLKLVESKVLGTGFVALRYLKN